MLPDTSHVVNGLDRDGKEYIRLQGINKQSSNRISGDGPDSNGDAPTQEQQHRMPIAFPLFPYLPNSQDFSKMWVDFHFQLLF